MKDFIKTNEFVRNANAFSELLLKFWHDLDGERAMPAGETLDTLKELKSKTRLKGEVLAREVLEVCPDMKDLQYYFDQWTKRLDLIDTCFVDFYKDDELHFELGLRLDDEQTNLSLQGIISGMNTNYNDVMEGKNRIANTYSLQIEDDTVDSMSDFRTSANLIEVEEKREKHSRHEEAVTTKIDDSYVFSISKQLPREEKISQLIDFLIEEKVICNETCQDDFIQRIRKANFSDIVISKNRMKATVCYIAKRYFSDNSEYKRTAEKSMGISKGKITSYNKIDDYLKKLKDII